MCDDVKFVCDSRASRLGAALSRVSMTATLAVCWVGVLTSATRAENFRWKLNPGEVLRYSLEEKLVSKLTVMGREKKSNTSHTLKLSWNVKSLSATGDIEIINRVERVRMRIDQP